MSQLTICLIICGLTIASYLWGKLSMATTAALSLTAFWITGCVSEKAILGNIGNANGMMMLAMFVVAAGFNKTQFVHKCAQRVNYLAKGNITKVMIGYVLLAIILSQFVSSPLVVFGIVSPMLAVSCEDLNVSPSKVMYPLGVATIASAVSIPLGAGATVFAELNGYLTANDYTTFQVTLADPMKARLPVVIVAAVYCIFFAMKVAPDLPLVPIAKSESRANGGKALPPFQEKCGYIVFGLTTLALIMQSQLKVPAWLICFAGAVFMVVTGVLSEQEAFAKTPWWMGMLYVGSMTMGSALTETGAGTVIGDALASVAGNLGNPYLIGLMFFVVPFVLTQVMSNRAVMTIFIPIAILACKSMGANPVGILILIQAACLTAFMTPMATPAVPMMMAAGGYDLKSLLKQSIIPSIIFCVVNVLWIMTVFPMF